MSDDDVDLDADGAPDDPNVPDIVAWLRDHPGDWEHVTVDDVLEADPTARRVLNEVYRRHELKRARGSSRRRRLRWAAALGGVALAAGGVAAAAVIGFGQPTHPESGALCRAEAELSGDVVALSPGEDPIAACGRVWSSGQFGPVSTMPSLTACIGPNGAIEVFPAGPGICERVGLSPADTVLSDVNELVLTMQDRLSVEINLGECRPVPEIAEQARGIIDEIGIDGWQVATEPGSETGVCGKMAVDSSTRTVTVHEL